MDAVKKDITSLSDDGLCGDRSTLFRLPNLTMFWGFRPALRKMQEEGSISAADEPPKLRIKSTVFLLPIRTTTACGLDIDNSSIQELQVISGTFNAEYGNAMSGIVNTVTKEGGRDYHGSLNVYGSDYLSDFTSYFPNVDHYNPGHNYQGSLSGPLPFTGDMITFFANGRYVYDPGYLRL